jgi:hypothetical protein
VYETPARSLPAYAPSTCGGATLRCHLKAFSRCNAGQVASSHRIHQKFKQGRDNRHQITVPKTAASLFRFHAHALNFIWRPNKRLAARVLDVRRRVGRVGSALFHHVILCSQNTAQLMTAAWST